MVFLFTANTFVRISVGADGIRLRRLLGRPRYVPFSAIQSVRSDGRNVEIKPHQGEPITVHFPAGKGGFRPLLMQEQAEDITALVDRIEERLEQEPSRFNGALLARGGRPTHEWLQSLSGQGDAPFRTPALADDELWTLVEDASGAATARAGAAVALRSRLDEGGRARLRVVAEACASPSLSEALRVVASEADERLLEDSLDSLQDAPREGRARKS